MSREVGLRARKKARTEGRIVNCAATLFAAHGYDATTMEEIGACAEVSRATVFNYFARKEDLVLAWFDGRRARIARVLAEGADGSGTAATRLRQAFRTLARIYEEEPETGRAMVRAWLQAGGPLLTPDSGTVGLFADAIRAGKREGDIARGTDPVRAGQLLFDAYIGALYRWVSAEREPPNLEKSLLAVLDLALTGIAAAGSGPKP